MKAKATNYAVTKQYTSVTCKIMLKQLYVTNQTPYLYIKREEKTYLIDRNRCNTKRRKHHTRRTRKKNDNSTHSHIRHRYHNKKIFQLP